MAKFRATLTVVKEYDVDEKTLEEFYGVKELEEAQELDRQALLDDPVLFIENEKCQFTAVVERVNE